MKFCTTLVLAAFATSVSAFSAIAPTSNGAATGSPEPVDRSMKGIDGDSATAFDPTSGTSPALIRNNMDQVWVPQVCANFFVVEATWFETGKPMCVLHFCLFFVESVLDLVVTERVLPCAEWYEKTL